MPSSLYIYSLGIVAENKTLGTDIVEVTPTEDLGYLDGELTTGTQDLTHTGTNANGEQYSIKITMGNTIACSWLPLFPGINRSPDVRRGQRVLIWRFGNADKYYWTTTGWDNHLFKLQSNERLTSASTDESETELNAKNSYRYVESSHKGIVEYTTTTKNGEKTTWHLQLNTKDGSFSIQDGDGNYCQIDNANARVHMGNANGCIVDINGDNIHAVAKAKMSFEAVDLDIKISNKITINAASLLATVTGKTIANLADLAVLGTTAAWTYANTTMTTALKLVGGLIGVAGTGGSGAKFTGPLEVVGDTTFDGTVKANGKTIDDTHTHPYAVGGDTGSVN